VKRPRMRTETNTGLNRREAAVEPRLLCVR
jgi:hypothetical protein